MTDAGGPVVIGGVGGSGTRLVASIVERLGVFIGRDLNASFDNLWFTLLFRRPRWYRDVSRIDDSHEIARLLAWFEDAMRGELRHSRELVAALDAAVEELIAQGLDRDFVEERRRRFLAWGRWSMPDAASWGWKEPNAHIYLEPLARHFTQHLRYIHVIRHGVEVARRTNRLQVVNWGWLFGIRPAPGPLAAERDPATYHQAIDYWIAANSRVMSIGPELLGDRFHLVVLDALRDDPVPVLEDLCQFLGCLESRDLIEELSTLPAPARDARPTDVEIGALTTAQRHGLAALGFPSSRSPEKSEQED